MIAAEPLERVNGHAAPAAIATTSRSRPTERRQRSGVPANLRPLYRSYIRGGADPAEARRLVMEGR
jgi:hypothetical protein